MRAKHKGKSRLIVIAALGLVLALLVTMVPGRTQKAEESAPEAPAVQTAFVFAGSTTYYQVNVGTEAAAVFQTEQEAKEVIDQIKEKYVDPKATIVSVTVEPEVTVEKISVPKSDEQPEVATDVKAVVEELTSGEDKVETYTVKEGDTLWDIAAAEKVSVEEIQAENPDLDLDYIAVGDELIISTTPAAQAVNVTVEYEQVSEIAVPYEIIYEEDPEMYEDEINVVKTSGADGKAEVTERIVAVNGREASKKQIAKKEIAAPVAEVIAYGTLEREDATIAVDDAEKAKKKDKKPEEQEQEEEEESLAMTLELEEEEETAEETADEDEETYEEEPEEESYDEEETYEEETYEEEPEEESYDEEETYEEESYEEESYEEETEEEESVSETDNQDETFSEPEEPAVVPEDDGSASDERMRVVNYALQFCGNPYVWGGTSLTNGCDCSGFIYSVFNNCGYGISRFPDSDFPHVSAAELQPGDITVYGGHYALYIGGGMEVSAVNEAQGIRTHPLYYSNSDFLYGIRVIQ